MKRVGRGRSDPMVASSNIPFARGVRRLRRNVGRWLASFSADSIESVEQRREHSRDTRCMEQSFQSRSMEVGLCDLCVCMSSVFVCSNVCDSPDCPNEWMNGNGMNGVSGSKASRGKAHGAQEAGAFGVYGEGRT
jgi:hypothetical protein